MSGLALRSEYRLEFTPDLIRGRYDGCLLFVTPAEAGVQVRQ